MPNFGKTCNSNGGLVLCKLCDFSSALNLHKVGVNGFISDFQSLDEVDNKVNHMVIFYLSNLSRKLETLLKYLNPRLATCFKKRGIVLKRDIIRDFTYSNKKEMCE